jgi:hypothetical protein
MLAARFIDGSYDTNECSRASDCQNHAFAEALNCQRPDDFPVRVENLEDFVPVPSVIPVDDVSVVVTARDRRRCEEQETNDKKQAAHFGLPSMRVLRPQHALPRGCLQMDRHRTVSGSGKCSVSEKLLSGVQPSCRSTGVKLAHGPSANRTERTNGAKSDEKESGAM